MVSFGECVAFPVVSIASGTRRTKNGTVLKQFLFIIFFFLFVSFIKCASTFSVEGVDSIRRLK